MKNVCRVHSFESAECLIDEILAVIIGEILGANDTMHVGLHQFLDMSEVANYTDSSMTDLNQVDLCETFVVSRFLNVKNGNDVFMIEVTKQFHFAESS